MHPGLLSLNLPSVAGWIEYAAKAGGVNRHIALYTSPIRGLAVFFIAWLKELAIAEISANLREAVAH